MVKPLVHVGNPHRVAVDGYDKVTGKAKYVGDMALPGMLHGKLFTSPVPHAWIKKLDVTPALTQPGVAAVITCEDFVNHGNFGWPVKDAYILAYKKVRYVGDPIAVVAAETEQAAEIAAAAIKLELEELPVISQMETALSSESPLIPLEPPLEEGNLCAKYIVRNGNPDDVLSSCEFVLDQIYDFQHQEHAYLETEGVLAIPEPDGSVTIYAPNQSPHINRDNAATVLGLTDEQVRIIQPPVGGSFGGKDDIIYQLTAHAAKLAIITNRPVRILLNREESLKISYKRAAARIHLQIGMDSTGRLRAAKANFLTDSGGYSSMTILDSWRASMHLAGTYRYEAAHVDTQAVYTNNGYSGAFRGFGNTQAAAASEIAIDELSVIARMDPIVFRLKNCLHTGDKAFTGNKLEHEVGLEQCINWVRNRSGWERKRKQYPLETGEIRQGVGVACYFHGSGLGGEGLDYARAIVRIERDHSITLQSGMTDYGQGSRTVFTVIAAEVLQVDPERIHILRPDTQTALETGPTVASRTSMVGGNATRVACQKLNQMLLFAAGDLLGCKIEQIMRHGENFIGPDEEAISIETIIDHAFKMGLQLYAQGYWQIPRIHWDFETGTGTPYFTYSFGAQVAEVEVNINTGRVRVTGIWAAHDGGKILFPKGARGQFIGGIVQGIGYALTEGFEYKEGYPQKLSLKKYTIPTALDVPDIDVKFIETTLPEGPFGAKNLAEPVMIATTPAIANAVFHAVGVRCRSFPIMPESLLANLRK